MLSSVILSPILIYCNLDSHLIMALMINMLLRLDIFKAHVSNWEVC